jgi:hypothetical protein
MAVDCGDNFRLVLGLLVSSARNFYDAQSTELAQLSTNIVLLDHTQAHYGSVAREERGQ